MTFPGALASFIFVVKSQTTKILSHGFRRLLLFVLQTQALRRRFTRCTIAHALRASRWFRSFETETRSMQKF